jgi:hypothetical protein
MLESVAHKVGFAFRQPTLKAAVVLPEDTNTSVFQTLCAYAILFSSLSGAESASRFRRKD